MKKQYLILSVVMTIALIGAGCKKQAAVNTALVNDDVSILVNGSTALEDTVNADTNSSDSNTNVAHINATVSSNTNVSTNTNTTTDTNTSTTIADTTAGDITVTAPKPDEELSSPFYVEGTAASGPVYIRVKSSGGTEIFTEKVSVNSGKFRGKLLFDFTHTTTGSIDVFTKDASGTETDLVNIPVRFKVASSSSTNTNSSDTTTNTNTGY